MQLEAGKIVEGKVTGITKFGAFVELTSGEVGMVHISEVAPTYVNDIAEHLTSGQTVTVKVLTIGEDGKISLSIKKAMKPEPRREGQSDRRPQNGNFRSQNSGQGGQNREGGRPPFKDRDGDRPARNGGGNGGNGGNRGFSPKPAYGARPTGPKAAGGSFEDMLSKFMQSSDEKISDIKKSREVSRRGGGRKGH